MIFFKYEEFSTKLLFNLKKNSTLISLFALLIAIISSSLYLSLADVMLVVQLKFIFYLSFSLKFYPQLYLNFTRRTTFGFSNDMEAYCLTGLAYRTVLTTLLYHSSVDLFVVPSIYDVIVFSHGSLLSLLIILQGLHYDKLRQLPSSYTLAIISILIILSSLYYVVCTGIYLS